MNYKFITVNNKKKYIKNTSKFKTKFLQIMKEWSILYDKAVLEEFLCIIETMSKTFFRYPVPPYLA